VKDNPIMIKFGTVTCDENDLTKIQFFKFKTQNPG